MNLKVELDCFAPNSENISCWWATWIKWVSKLIWSGRFWGSLFFSSTGVSLFLLLQWCTSTSRRSVHVHCRRHLSALLPPMCTHSVIACCRLPRSRNTSTNNEFNRNSSWSKHPLCKGKRLHTLALPAAVCAETRLQILKNHPECERLFLMWTLQ